MAKYMLVIAAFLTAIAQQSAVHASLVYVGSWQVDEGPTWFSVPPNGPLAYTGQEAAAFLFGGSPANYVISTINNNPINVNHMAWYSVIGYIGNQGNGGSLLAENFNLKYLGQFYGPTSGYPTGTPIAATSAFVRDNAQGGTFRNFAFINVPDASPVPEPASMTLVCMGAFGLVLRARRRSKPQPVV